MSKAKDARYPEAPKTKKQKDYIRGWNRDG